MWLLKGNRKSLTEILLGNGSQHRNQITAIDSFPKNTLQGDSLYLIWNNEPTGKQMLPNLIVVANNNIRDFLAWAITYFTNYKPFSAYSRILEFNTLKALEQRYEYPNLDGIEGPCLGLIMGEVLLLSSATQKKPNLNPMICHTTISQALSRALALGDNPEILPHIIEKWCLARKLSKQPYREINYKEINTIFQVISLLREENLKPSKHISNNLIPDSIITACLQIREQGCISKDLWKELTKDFQEEVRNALRNMEGSREERVRYFQKLFSTINIDTNSNSNIEEKFIYGFLCSLIGQGTLSHYELINQYAKQFPTALLWYSLCAGLYKKNELLNSFNVLGRRLLRELLRNKSILDAPLSDISIDELEIFLEGEHQKSDFRTFTPNRIDTELYPGISTYLIWSKQEAATQMELFETKTEGSLQREQLSELGSLLHRAVDIYMSLSANKELTRKSQQPPESGKKKRGSGKKNNTKK